MSWTTSKAELRSLLSDGDADKLRYRKKLIGRVDGVNTYFKSLEKRRLTNFKTEANATLGVFINGVRLSEGAGIVADNTAVGEVQLTVPPAVNVYVEGTYYLQWFIDSELTIFLTQAAQWLGFDVADNIPGGLRPAATYYAAQESYHKMSLRWAETLSEEFRLEDAPAERAETPMEMYRRLAEDARKKSVQLRDQYYSGKGEEKRPNSVSIFGCVPRVVPNR